MQDRPLRLPLAVELETVAAAAAAACTYSYRRVKPRAEFEPSSADGTTPTCASTPLNAHRHTTQHCSHRRTHPSTRQARRGPSIGAQGSRPRRTSRCCRASGSCWSTAAGGAAGGAAACSASTPTYSIYRHLVMTQCPIWQVLCFYCHAAVDPSSGACERGAPFCSASCVDSYQMQVGTSSENRRLCYARDRGVCAVCREDCHDLYRRLVPLDSARRYQPSHRGAVSASSSAADASPPPWQARHPRDLPGRPAQ